MLVLAVCADQVVLLRSGCGHLLQGPGDVQALGIANYNDECRKIVMRYSKEWEVCRSC